MMDFLKWLCYAALAAYLLFIGYVLVFDNEDDGSPGVRTPEDCPTMAPQSAC
ncbi:MAG: hypothetical protein JWM90_3114 [Thermoleophilia bacterium]|nr:hypothetical protein [Thermoleophilia bacterium]